MNAHSSKEETQAPSFIDLPGSRRLAYFLSEGKTPGVVFLGGFRSDMNGVKAKVLEAFCKQDGRRFLRFDYTGHGRSFGNFRQGTISSWKQDAIDIIDKLMPGKNFIVGSSMGAWLTMLVARDRPDAIAGLLGLASAADFTEKLIWNKLDDIQKKQMQEEGVIFLPSCNGQDPYPITRGLIEDGRQNLLLGSKLKVAVPVRLLHGNKDEEVPWQISVTFMDSIISPDITLELVKDGDHRLSKPEELVIMCRTLKELVLIS